MPQRKNREGRHTTNRTKQAVSVGFFAGLFWGGAWALLQVFAIMRVHLGFFIEPGVRHSWLETWRGTLIGWAVFILVSVVASCFYTLLFRSAHWKGPWPGIAYGAVWWALVFVLYGWLLGAAPNEALWEIDSLVSGVCLFLLWGVFVGYSVTFEFTDERLNEPAAS